MSEEFEQSEVIQIERVKRWYDRIPGSLTDSHPGEFRWWADKFLICLVFAITGSTTMYVVKPLLKDYLHLEGSLINGPWSYRFAYVSLITPSYSAILFLVSTLLGKSAYFKPKIVRMWSRFIPSSILRKFTTQQKEN